MRKFASPINSSPLPSDSLTLSLPQTPITVIPVVEIPEAPVCPECPACSFDELLVEYSTTGYLVVVFIMGENLSSSDVVWEITWTLINEENPPSLLYAYGFIALIDLNPLMDYDDIITAKATVCDTTKTVTITSGEV